MISNVKRKTEISHNLQGAHPLRKPTLENDSFVNLEKSMNIKGVIHDKYCEDWFHRVLSFTQNIDL